MTIKTLDYRVQLKFCIFELTDESNELIVSINIFIYETHYEISNHAVYAPSKSSDQHAHMHSLERDFAGRLNVL